MDSRFVPHDCEFCIASIKHGTRQTQTRLAMSWFICWMRFQRKCGANGIVVFDIDDTLVDAKERQIESVVEVYLQCLEIGFRCAIVTARPESPENRRETISMLRSHGISNWESLYMMPKSVQVYDAEHISKYKRSARDDIETRHRILGNIGDMWHDLLRFPLVGCHKTIEVFDHTSCGVLFPPMSHGEVAIKLVGHVE